jgi:ribosome-binding factor A
MNDNWNERMGSRVREVAAEFLAREANRNSLITVTRAELSENGRRCNIFITVFPDSAEEPALKFANRNRRELSEFFKKRVKGVPPRIEFVIDRGEKNRQRLDELSE